MKIYRSFAPALALVLGAAFPSFAATCSGTNLSSVGTVTPRLVDGAVVYSTRILNIDADGAPNSYRVDGNGLSFTCDGVVAIENGRRISPPAPGWQEKCRAAWKNAVDTGNYSGVAIFGFAVGADGKPLIQKAGDPLPGEAYISATSVTIPDTPSGTQRHYVDAVAIPYVVLPGNFAARRGIGPGDVAVAYYPKTGKVAPAVFGDTGGKLDEASVRLHQDLGSQPMVRRNGVDRAKSRIETGPGAARVSIVIFPGKSTHRSTDADAWRADIAGKAQAALAAWGGAERLKSCAN